VRLRCSVNPTAAIGGREESWQKALLNTPSPFLAWLHCPSSFCLEDFLQWRWSEQWQLLRWQWGKEMFVTGSDGKKMEEQE
jgi:hypothetical protein